MIVLEAEIWEHLKLAPVRVAAVSVRRLPSCAAAVVACTFPLIFLSWSPSYPLAVPFITLYYPFIPLL